MTSVIRRNFPSSTVYPVVSEPNVPVPNDPDGSSKKKKSLIDIAKVKSIFFQVGGADVWPRGQTGPHSTQPFHDLAKLWRIWLPPEAEKTFKRSISSKALKMSFTLSLITLN